jgi:hypothetical protein
MTRTSQLLSLIVLVALLTSGIFLLSSSADDSDVGISIKSVYRTMFRHEIDELGGHEKGKSLRANSTEALQAGLNKLSGEGWQLVAVEGGRSVPVPGPNQMTIIYPPVYIFRQVGR